MRATTVIWLAARNVGSPHDGVLIHNGTLTECIMELAKWLGPKSMNKCVDIVLARSKVEAEERLNRGRNGGFAVSDDLEADLMRMLDGGSDSVNQTQEK